MTYSCSLCGLQYSRMWSLNRHKEKCKGLQERKNTPVVANVLPGNSSSNKLVEEASTESEDDESAESEPDKSTESLEGKQTDSEAEELAENEGIDHCTTDSESCESSEEEKEEEEEDVAMDEEEKNKVIIKWPVSRTYMIQYPWSYWGEVPRIKKHVKWLERMRDAEPPTIAYNIQSASVSQIGALCEIAYNYLNFHIPAERSNWKEIRKHKRAIRLLANADVDIEVKREEVLRRGADFVQLLLHVIDPLLLFDIPRKMDID